MKKNCDTCKWGDVPIESKEAPCKICYAGSHYTALPQTNADRIRAMTDEELAEWIAKHMYCGECMFFNDDTGTCNYEYRFGKGCNGAMLDWLRQEVDG